MASIRAVDQEARDTGLDVTNGAPGSIPSCCRSIFSILDHEQAREAPRPPITSGFALLAGYALAESPPLRVYERKEPPIDFAICHHFAGLAALTGTTGTFTRVNFTDGECNRAGRP